jgi:beta-lactamase class A
MNDLDRKLNALCEGFPFRSGYYFKDLKTGLVLQRNAETIFNAASLRKVSILMAALAAVKNGRVSLEQPLIVEPKYQANESGVLQHLAPGLELTLKDVLFLMIIVSDSTATGMVSDLLTLDDINAYCRRIGLSKTQHRFGVTPPDYSPSSPKNLTTAFDTAFLFETILKREADRLEVSPELCGLALEILSAQKIRNRLPALLPTGIRAAHKTGLDFDCVHDAGIIYDPCGKPLFLLTVLIDRVPDELPDKRPGKAAAMHLIARLSRSCFEHLTEVNHG